jgi:hypothetical protein
MQLCALYKERLYVLLHLEHGHTLLDATGPARARARLGHGLGTVYGLGYTPKRCWRSDPDVYTLQLSKRSSLEARRTMRTALARA